MHIPRLLWLWPAVILLSTIVVALITFLFPGIGVRPVVVMGFLFVIPGMTVARFFRLNEVAAEWMFALVLSFTIDAFVAGIILYAGQWSPKNILSFLLGFCFSGAVAQLALIRPASVPAPPLLLEDSKTIVLNTPLPFEDQETSTLKEEEGLEDTQERPAVLHGSGQSLWEHSEEQTVSLEKPALSGKEA